MKMRLGHKYIYTRPPTSYLNRIEKLSGSRVNGGGHLDIGISGVCQWPGCQCLEFVCAARQCRLEAT